MMKSGFTLCDDLMGLVGERVVAKRDQDTMDYWCGLPKAEAVRAEAASVVESG